MWILKVMFDSFRGWVFAITLLLALAVSEKTSERVGDIVQVALPVAAFVCTKSKAEFTSLLVRFVGLEIAIKGHKHGLGNADINQRPNEKLRGFPSGHTSVATFGASALINSCLVNNPLAAITVAASAVFVGGSRIGAKAHYVFQVFAGFVFGLFFERLFWIIRMLQRAFTTLFGFLFRPELPATSRPTPTRQQPRSATKTAAPQTRQSQSRRF